MKALPKSPRPWGERGGERIARKAIRVAWLLIIPALLAGITVRYFIPVPWQARGTWAASLADAGHRYPHLVWVGLLVLYAGLIQYWANRIPGGRFLSSMPGWLAARTPKDRLKRVERAVQMHAVGAHELPRPQAADPRESIRAQALERALCNLEEAIIGGSDQLDQRAAEVGYLTRDALSRDARRRAARWASLVGMASLVALLVRASVGRVYEVHGGSMFPTLEPGDRIVGNRLAYGFSLPGVQHPRGARTPRRGDVVVFDNPQPGSGEARLIKRVIGLPGDRIEMYGNLPVINGWKVPSCEVGYDLHASHMLAVQGRVAVEFLEDRAYLALYHASVPPFAGAYTVAPGEVFVLGDNRPSSSDSRAWNDGKGGGLELAKIEARGWRFLAGGRLDERADLGLLGRSIELRPHSQGVDLSALREGIVTCLQQRPTDTFPPSGEVASPSVAVSPITESTDGR